MRCEEIMKRNVHVVLDSDTAQAAAKLMRDENIGFLPVCDDERKVLGTITDRDICIRVDAEGRSAAECSVEAVMTHEVIACRPADELGEAEQLMSTHHKSRILCTDDRGRLCGVISLSDIADHETLRRTAATLRGVTSRESRL